MTIDGQVLGTPAYMSPEQAKGESHTADRRSDVYSLGVILFELLTGERPFRGNARMLLKQVVEDEAPSARNLDGHISRDLETICAKCLEKAPPRRYGSAHELADELRRFLAGEPIHARPVGRTERLWRWYRRGPLVAGLSAVSLLLAMAIVIGAPVWAVRESVLRQQSQDESNRARIAESHALAAAENARRNLAETNFQAARLAGERGRWRLALKNLDAALEAGHPDPIRVRLERLRALEVLEEVGPWGQEIDALAARQDLGRYEAEVRLHQGIRLRSLGQEAEGLKLVRRAVAMGLPDADDAFARAMIADTSPEVVDHLRRALQADPFHHRATAGLIGILLSLGQRDEARQRAMAGRLLFPEDYTFPLALALIATVEDDSAAAQTWLAEMARLCDVPTAKMARNLVDLVDQMCKIAASNSADSSKNALALAQIVLRLLQLQQQRVPTAATGKDGPNAPRPVAVGLVAGLSFTSRPVKQAFTIVLAAHIPTLSTLFQRNHDREIDALTKAVAIHPEGCFLYHRAGWLLVDKRFQEAEAGFLKAAETPSFLPGYNRDALYAASIAALSRHFAGGGKREDLELAVKHLRRYVALGPVTPEVAAQSFPTAFLAGDLELARRLISEPLRQRPKDLTLLFWKAKLELAAHAYAPAVEAADAMLRCEPNDTRALQIKEFAVQKLRDYLQQTDSKKAAPKAQPPWPEQLK